MIFDKRNKKIYSKHGVYDLHEIDANLAWTWIKQGIWNKRMFQLWLENFQNKN